MVQVFIKAPNVGTLFLELSPDYTISAKELYIKVFNLFYKSIKFTTFKFI